MAGIGVRRRRFPGRGALGCPFGQPRGRRACPPDYPAATLTAMCGITWEAIGKFISAALPIGIAIAVAYIAWAQYEINRRQYRLALFEKRMAIYNSVTARCAAVVQTMKSDLQENIKFIRETRDHEFLFGPEVKTFIDEIWKQGNNLDMYQALRPARPDKETEIMNWFNVQLSEARKIFLKYMNFTDAY
jgi:hypothetical protein